jgi:hypothetical protein
MIYQLYLLRLQTILWDDGCADFSLLSQALNWECHLPAIATALDPSHSRIAFTTQNGNIALLDWRGPAIMGVGLTQIDRELIKPEFGAIGATFTVASRPLTKVC